MDILQGGRNIINDNILGIQIEAEFKQLYKSQPLFAEIDSDIREKFNFELFDIKKHYWKYKEGQYIGSSKGQVIFTDLLYFRDSYEFPKWCDRFSDTEAITKIVMACFMSILYGYHDYALCLLNQQAVIKRMGIKINNAHRAGADALSTGEVFLYLIQEASSRPLTLIQRIEDLTRSSQVYNHKLFSDIIKASISSNTINGLILPICLDEEDIANGKTFSSL